MTLQMLLELYMLPVSPAQLLVLQSSRINTTFFLIDTCRSIDASDALAIPGVKAFYSGSDIPDDRNECLPALPGEWVFAKKQVNYYGENIGIIVAESQSLADEAAKK